MPDAAEEILGAAGTYFFGRFWLYPPEERHQ
jgi:hypothetical protein